MDGVNGITKGNAGRLQQMSEDMKLHIAQLKAELSNATFDRRELRDLEKEFRNKAIAQALRKKMEAEKQIEKSDRENTSPPLCDTNSVVTETERDLTQQVTEDPPQSLNHPSKQDDNDAQTLSSVPPFATSLLKSSSVADVNSLDPNISSTPDAEMFRKKKSASAIKRSELQEESSSSENEEARQELAKIAGRESGHRSNDVSVSNDVNAKLVSVSDTDPITPTTSRHSLSELGRERIKLGGGDGKKTHSSSDTTISSPRSFAEPTEDSSIPVKYLQMTTNSPKLLRRGRPGHPRKTKSRSSPSSARGSRGRLDELNGLQLSNGFDSMDYEELQAQVVKLQMQCELLAEKSIKIKKEQRTRAEEKISTLKKNNGELANIARRLEEKARSLQEHNVKKTQELASVTRELQQQKRAHQRHRVRWESEHARSLAECNDELTSSRSQIDDLKRALRQARREKIVVNPGKESGEDVDALKQNQKEILRLQKLASAASAKVVVRSLSTPVTARQKILEESNRNLRRQIATLESNLQEAESRFGKTKDLHENISLLEKDKTSLQKEIENLHNTVSVLESDLQESKVEASDVSQQLTSIKDIHHQLENEYSTVHDQLAVAINERDKAARQCIENATKLTEMEAVNKELEMKFKKNEDFQKSRNKLEDEHRQEISSLVNSHEKIVSDYQEALLTLQSKVSQLERQCREQDNMNKNMKEQLSRLTELSRTSEELKEKLPQKPDNRNNNNIKGAVYPGHPALPEPRLRSYSGDQKMSRSKKGSLSSEKSSRHSELQQLALLDDTEIEDFDEEVMVQDAVTMPTAASSQDTASVLRLFIAKYTYNPYEGPNEHPEYELPLVAGDYLYVHGSVDEDGFYEGELMNGKRGLVPSNFIELLHEKSRDDHVSPKGEATNAPASDEGVYSSKAPVSRSSSVRSPIRHRSANSEFNSSCCSAVTSSIDTSADSRDSRRLAHSSGRSLTPNRGVFPYPKKLRIDKKLSHTLIIGWIAPELFEDDLVEEYHILVDGCLVTIVDGDKCKAVVENIYHSKSYTICVCCVTQRGRSDPGHCVLVYGKQQTDLCISGLTCEHLTTGSAKISWNPLNSNFIYNVKIEEAIARHSKQLPGHQRQMMVPSPLYRHIIDGLKPKTCYDVTVRAHNPKLKRDISSEALRFTTPVYDPPGPPLNVNVESVSSLSDDFVTLSWVPDNNMNEKGDCRVVEVVGYDVYLNDVLIASVDSSTAVCHQIPMKTFSQHVCQVVREDKSRFHPSFGFSHGLPPANLTMKAVGKNGSLSDSSDPYQLEESFIKHLMSAADEDAKEMKENTAVSMETNVQKLSSNTPRDQRPIARNFDSRPQDDAIFKSKKMDRSIESSPPMVPAIEITQDTSSDEDLPPTKNQVGGDTSSPRNMFTHKPLSSHSHRRVRPVAREREHPELRDRSDCARSNSWVGGRPLDVGGKRWHRKNYVRGIRRRVHSDEESVTSISSGGHSTTSTSGSSNHKRRLVPQSHLRTHHAWRRVAQENERLSKSPASPQRTLQEQERDPILTSAENVNRSADDENEKRGNRRRLRSSLTISSQSDRSFSGVDPVDDSRVSLFVALYDYNPCKMSPNTDCFEDELGFVEGQLLKVYGDKDDDGFYVGENQHKKRGYIPCNMVSQVDVDDYTMLEELFERGHLPSVSPHDVNSSSHSKDVSDRHLHSDLLPEDYPVIGSQSAIFRALYDYDPREASPNIDAEIELSFSRGDLIRITGSVDEDGFYRGELKGEYGLVPSNFVELVTSDRSHHVNSSNRKVSTTTMTSPVHSSRDFVTDGEPPSVTSTSSNNSSRRSDTVKKKGILSKGKKLFKKLGGNEAKAKR